MCLTHPSLRWCGERDASISSSAAASMTEFREVKTTADDLRVELEVKSQLDKDVSQSPVIDVGEREIRALTAQLQPQ